MIFLNILFNVYLAISFIRTGYSYCEWKAKDKPGINTFLNALIYGFFGWIIEIYFSLRKRCGKCLFYKNGRCQLKCKFLNKYEKACKMYEENGVKIEY